MVKPILTFQLILLLLLSLTVGCGSRKVNPRSASYTDAVELKLKFRELADQMLATMPNHILQGVVAMPVTFVDQNNTQSSSVLGRLIAESMFYEFNQRGFPTREYRLTGNIEVRGARNNLVLVPNKIILADQNWASLLLGTYCVDEDATFINARLVRAKDGLVLRTAQLVLPNTPIIYRLAQKERDYVTRDGDPLEGLYQLDTGCGKGGYIPLRQYR
ncbi:MAG: hypothetical protein IJU40_06830 [Desulfovibrionaceae bacterium]|nr:hypothetical protein [Desulfovibrionaceae bacterium]